MTSETAGETTSAEPVIRPDLGENHHRPVVETRGLGLRFGGHTVLQNVDLVFPQGTITAVIGPTGSGKSTFLRTLNRMNDRLSGFRRSGDVLFEGTSLWASGVEPMVLRRRVGMLFQRPNPFPMSIGDNVAAGVRAHRIAGKRQAKDIVESRLREVGLWDAVSNRLGDSPFRLSGGQQQLLCLARTLAVGPDVLLLDEPTSSLDPVSTAAIEELIRSLTPALTIVIVTHNLAQARRVSHRTAYFNAAPEGGRLVESGTTEQVLDNPRDPQTVAYVTGRVG